MESLRGVQTEQIAVCPTLPLSGRQGVWGGEADSWWWYVHSKGLFELWHAMFNADWPLLIAFPL